MWTVVFWRAAVERAVKTAAQAALALLGAEGLGLMSVDWPHIGQVAALSAVASLLMSVGSAPFGPSGSPSLLHVDRR